MNISKAFLLFLSIWLVQCTKPKSDDKGVKMESDINPSEGMGISIHKATDTLILQEEFGELSENPNVMLMDMDVVKGESSGFVQVVKQGEKLVPDERKGENTSK